LVWEREKYEVLNVRMDAWFEEVLGNFVQSEQRMLVDGHDGVARSYGREGFGKVSGRRKSGIR